VAGAKPNSAAGLLEALLYLAKNTGLQKNIGRNGISFTREKYGKTRLFNDIKDLYRRLV